MFSMIESLESRQLLSASLFTTPGHYVGSPAPAVHAPFKIAVPVQFAGEAATSGGQCTELLMAVTKTAAGYNVKCTIMNPNGPAGVLPMTANTAGLMTYSGPAGQATINVQAQISTDGNSITGTFSTAQGGGGTTGTITMSRMLRAPVKYVGSAMDSNNEKEKVLVTVNPTVGGYVALVEVINPKKPANSNDNENGFVLTGGPSGQLTYTGPDENDIVQVNAQLSANGATIAGTFADTNNGQPDGGGTFTVHRS